MADKENKEKETQEESSLALPEFKDRPLTDRERAKYQDYVLANKPPLSQTLQAQLYELFKSGLSCEEIHKLNLSYPLGAIVKARIDNKWDDQKQVHQTNLVTGARERVQQTQLEAIEFITLLLKSVHKQHGDKLKRYLQTGNEEELGQIVNISSLKSYKDILELLLKATGQSQDQKTKVSGEIKHTVEVPQEKKFLTESEAEAVLKLFDKDDKNVK